MACVRPSLVVYVALALSVSCKSTNAQVKGAGSDKIRAIARAIWRAVPMKDLRYVLKPAEPKIAMAEHLAGIQYCRGTCESGKMGLSTRAVALTIAGAVEGKNSLYFPINYDSHYAFNRPSQVDQSPVNDYGNEAYQISFTDAKHATLTAGFVSLQDGSFSQSTGAAIEASMRLVAPNHWVRSTVGYPDYDLYTIIDRNGNETQYYQTFVDDIQTSGLDHVMVAVPTDSDFGKGGPVPTGPARDVDRVAAVDAGGAMSDSPDAATRSAPSADDSAPSAGGDAKGGGRP